MMRAIVRDFYYKNSYSIREVSTIFNIPKSTIQRWIHDSSIILKRKKRPIRFPSILPFIKKYITDNPFTSLLKLRTAIVTSLKISVSLSTLSKYLRSLKITYKRASHKLCSDPVKLSNQRKAFISKRKYISDSRIICIDETYFYSNQIPIYGWSPPNINPSVRTKSNRIKYSVIMAITKNGILGYEIHKTNIRTDTFTSFIRNKVLPLSQNKYILMDNVTFHKGNELINMITANNTKTLFIPPYSPEFNPIEYVFSPIKHNFRQSLECSKNETYIASIIDSYKNTKFNKIYKHVRDIII
jgi:transposase